MMFYTQYALPNGDKRSTQVFARDEADLQRHMVVRGMDEVQNGVPRPDSYPLAPQMPSHLFEQGHYPEAMHSLIWVSMIAVQAGVIDGWELLCDNGLIHEMGHLLARRGIDIDFPKGVLLRRIRDFERSVPGVHPTHAMSPKDAAAWIEADDGRQAVYESRLGPQWAYAPTSKLTIQELNTALGYRDEKATRYKSKRTSPKAKPGTAAFAIEQREQALKAKQTMIDKALAGGIKKAAKPPETAPPLSPSGRVTWPRGGVTGATPQKAMIDSPSDSYVSADAAANLMKEFSQLRDTIFTKAMLGQPKKAALSLVRDTVDQA